MATYTYSLEENLLLPGFEQQFTADRKKTSGVLPSQDIRDMIERKHIRCLSEIVEANIQPASLDLRLSRSCYRVQASFLPGRGNTVLEKVSELEMSRLDLANKTVLEKGCVYIVELEEELALSNEVRAKANPKSTTGRLDIFTRLITDYGNAFEEVRAGYHGKLYAEIVPRTFPIAVRAGMKLNQIRFLKGETLFADSHLSELHKKQRLSSSGEDLDTRADIDRGLRFTLNLPRGRGNEIVAYRAKNTTPIVDLERLNYYEPDEFWEIKLQNTKGRIILDPGDFYILASKERVRVPADYAAEMVPIDTSIGEFRSHYAGFFDPGFGCGEHAGTQAVLEVRAHEVPFVLEHEQTVGRLEYLPLLCVPDKIYGENIGSSYSHQALTLSKQFRRPEV